MRDALSSQRGMLKLLAAAALVPLAISLEAGQAAKPISIEGATGLEFVQVVHRRPPTRSTKRSGWSRRRTRPLKASLW